MDFKLKTSHANWFSFFSNITKVMGKVHLLFSGLDISISTVNLFLPWSDACLIPSKWKNDQRDRISFDTIYGRCLWIGRLSCSSTLPPKLLVYSYELTSYDSAAGVSNRKQG